MNAGDHQGDSDGWTVKLDHDERWFFFSWSHLMVQLFMVRFLKQSSYKVFGSLNKV